MHTTLKQQHTPIPLLGLGTWRLRGNECEETVKMALDLGYRHIDTADVYQNHTAIAKAICSYPRQDLFLVTKVAITGLEPEQVKKAVPRFLNELGVDYIDLLLIHWPNPDIPVQDTLEAMVACKNQGLVRAIGVSNFVRSHLESLLPFSIATNQIELHPYLQRRELRAAYRKANISITAYRPLAKGALEQDLTLQKIGKRHMKSAAQVALRWMVQQDIVVIPKASTAAHLKENMAIFDFALSPDEIQEIAALDSGTRYCAPDGFPLFED